MGDVSVMARRLSADYVQYGWSGNGGYFSNVGYRLLKWYNTKSKDLIDYLFNLGQLEYIGVPGSEQSPNKGFYSLHPTGTPHWVGTSEEQIFSRIAFVDYGYFYDSDNEWYYIFPDSFRIKVPLEHISYHLDNDSHEFEYHRTLEKMVLEKILLDIPTHNDNFNELFDKKSINPKIIFDELKKEHFPLYEFCDNYRTLCEFFDNWILVKTSSDNKDIQEIVIKERGEKHIETIFW